MLFLITLTIGLIIISKSNWIIINLEKIWDEELDNIEIKTKPFLGYLFYSAFLIYIIPRFNSFQVIIYSTVFLILYIVSLIDLEKQIIPDKYNLLILVLGMINIYFNDTSIKRALISTIPIVIFFIIILAVEWFLKLEEEAMGGGDLKLYFVLSFMLNLQSTLMLLFLSNFLLVLRKNKKETLPFVPYIFSGYGLLFLCTDILNKYLL